MLSGFLKSIYKPALVIVCFVLFFLGYNAFLVDNSLVNLKVALSKTAEAKTTEDFERIKPLLKIPLLKEISKAKTSERSLTSMELVENIATSAKSSEQVEDIRFWLKSLIADKEKERGGVLSFLDRINGQIFAPVTKLSKEKIESKIKSLLIQIKSLQDKAFLQQAFYDLGNAYLELPSLPKAEEAFLEAARIIPSNPLAIKAKFNLAWGYKSIGEYEKAAAYFEELSKNYAQMDLATSSQFQIADTLYKTASKLYEKGDYAKSRDKYAYLAEKYPDFVVTDLAIFQAGYISYYDLGDIDSAVKYFNDLEKRFAKTNVVQHVKSVVQEVILENFRITGFRLLKNKKYTEAIAEFEKSLAVNPSDGRSLSGISLALYWTGNKEGALEKAAKALYVSAEDEATVINCMFVYINSRHSDEAIRIAEQYLGKGRLAKRAELYYNLSYAYVILGKIGEASTYLNLAIRLNRDFIFAYNNLACALWSSRDYAGAIRMLKEAVALSPDYSDAYFNLGIVYLYLNRLEESYASFGHALDANPDYKEAISYRSHIEERLKYKP